MRCCKGLVGISFARNEVINVVLRCDPSSAQMVTKVGDKEMDELVLVEHLQLCRLIKCSGVVQIDMPDCVRPKTMNCVCYPLLCEDIQNPDSYVPAARPGRPARKRPVDAFLCRCVSVHIEQSVEFCLVGAFSMLKLNPCDRMGNLFGALELFKCSTNEGS